MKSLTALIVLALITILFAGTQVFALEKCKRNYLIGVGADQLKNKTAPKALPGLATEFLTEIKHRVPCVYNDVPISPEKALLEMQNFRLDLYAFAFSDEQFKKVADEEVIYSTNRILLVDKKIYKAGLTVKDYMANPKIKFGAISGSFYWFHPEEMKLLAEQKRVTYSAQIDLSGEMLAKGKVQAIFVSPAFLNRMIANQNILQSAVPIPDPTFRLTVVLEISKKRVTPEERKLFSDAIADMRREGVIEKILLNYVSPKDLKAYYKY